MMLNLILTLFLFQLPGEVTRGPATLAPAQIVVNPSSDGFDVTVHWGELAAMCTVLSLIYVVITKAVIAPMIDKKLAEFTEKMEKRYVTTEKVQAHAALNEERHDVITKQLDQIWRRVNSK